MHLIVGLGNIGQEYALTRHNIGFMVCDYWLKSLGGSTYKNEHKSLVVKFKIENPQIKNEFQEVLLTKPQTFMNKSGEAVQALLQFYKIPLQNLLVIHDDIDQPYGSMKFHHNRGHGGQNGVRNITELLGTSEYSRLKMGVGRPADPRFEIANYVLSPFAKEQQLTLKNYLDVGSQAIEAFIFNGLNKASTKYNGPVKLDF